MFHVFVVEQHLEKTSALHNCVMYAGILQGWPDLAAIVTLAL